MKKKFQLCMAVFLAAACLYRSDAAIIIVRDTGEVATTAQVNTEWNTQFGGWDITLNDLYNPGGETIYKIYGTGGETIKECRPGGPRREPFNCNCPPRNTG